VAGQKSGVSKRPRPRAGRTLLWILLIIAVLIAASLMFGGFQKGTKAAPGALPHNVPRVPGRALTVG